MTSVLNLAGLWGGKRIPRNWVDRVAPNKGALAAKVRHLLFSLCYRRIIESFVLF
jgi:hypothetical protein